jgi:hypothetical protein
MWIVGEREFKVESNTRMSAKQLRAKAGRTMTAMGARKGISGFC